ncbi:hypothetical protein [Agrococcus sp. ARC_14]|uniref:hypothetical protein n=1 Tax=Agrococcus sp. ARC_14 TaxID=2919927 RepID=UPI001F070885|nr:hypothetical protein [Agrococcus sp. ARC_14]MCH1882102.1 hypothetical protein [Agrococcus sp. ARC_14]
MDFLHSLLVAAHMVGLALLVGTFFLQMRAKSGFNFTILLTGASIQLVSGIALYGLAMAGDGEANHMKLGIKGLIAVVVFIAALIGFLRTTAIRKEKAALQQGGAVSVGNVEVGERRLKTFFHIAGGLALLNLLIAVFWQ